MNAFLPLKFFFDAVCIRFDSGLRVFRSLIGGCFIDTNGHELMRIFTNFEGGFESGRKGIWGEEMARAGRRAALAAVADTP